MPTDTDVHLSTARSRAALVPQLSRFVVAAEEKHLGRAADRLGITQPTLSRTLARLQEDLGIALFATVGRRLVLTAAGKDLLGSAATALSIVDDGMARLLGDTDAASGRVRLGFLRTVGLTAVPTALAAFRKQHPQIRFQLTGASTAAMIDQLLAGALDLCIVSPAVQRPGLELRVVARQRIEVVVGRDHLLATRRSAGIELAELSSEPFILLKPGYGLRSTTDALFRAAGVVPPVAFEADDTALAESLVAAGLGVALLPPSPVPHPGVARLALGDGSASREIVLAWSSARPLSRPASLLRDALLRDLAEASSLSP